ncbi:MAG TPA: DUF1697 domain-containing protein [Candidatus Saccharimonadales bacterium]|nr:DUF1697 domain-containing protein [Candidatus Saccharimonadales bacterium]
MIYVALLRGINVGGNTKVEMSRLKVLFKSLGCKDVSTYINSGNVIFADDRSRKELEAIIESGIEKTFGLKVRIVLRDSGNIKKLCREIPVEWTNDKQQKTDVLFLWDEVDDADILKKIRINPDIEKVLYVDGALVWNIGRQNVTRGGGVKLIKTDYYTHMTARNINTVRKLNQLMS